MDKQAVIKEIEYDIDRGVYESFPKLKSRLEYISNKLQKSIYVINDDAQLSRQEIQTLIENEYIDEYDI